jgi:hypothetical protein
VKFFFRSEIQGKIETLALVDLYSTPDMEILEESFNTVWLCAYEPGRHLTTIPAESILAVVAMVPEGDEDLYFLVEKPGLDVISLSGYAQVDGEVDGDDADESDGSEDS